MHCRSEFTARSIANAASAAVNGAPSENVTPLRMSNVHSVGEVCRHPVDSSGCRSPVLGSRSISGSVMLERTTMPVEVSELSHGSSVGGSWERTMRSVLGS